VYDALNREVRMIEPLGHTSTMVYDADDNLVDSIDCDGRHGLFTLTNCGNVVTREANRGVAQFG
jgi:YD repeat-containing protein